MIKGCEVEYLSRQAVRVGVRVLSTHATGGGTAEPSTNLDVNITSPVRVTGSLALKMAATTTSHPS